MNEMPVSTQEPKKSNKGLIIGIVVFTLFCCFCLLLVGGWYYGDAILQSLNF